MWQVVDLHPRPGVDAHPGPGGDVGDRILAGQELVVAEPRVEHPVEALGLVLVARDGVVDLLRRVAEEDVRLPLHRTDAAHLEHDPLDDRRATLAVGRQETPGLLGQVDQDGARLEDREVALVAVDDGGDAAAGVELQVPGLLLLAVLQADGAHAVGHPQLLEQDGDLPAVRGGRGVEIDHAPALTCPRAPCSPRSTRRTCRARISGRKSFASSQLLWSRVLPAFSSAPAGAPPRSPTASIAPTSRVRFMASPRARTNVRLAIL